MKIVFMILSVLMMVICGETAEQEVFIPKDKLRITEEGIFICTKNRGPVPVNQVSYNYATREFYYRTQLVRCGNCGRNTYDPITGICYNPDCPYSP